MALWQVTHYFFKHDGSDKSTLKLLISGDISGGAKAEDDHYARSGAEVVGTMQVRTGTSPATSRTLFELKGAGESAAKHVEVGDIDAVIPIGDGVINVNIPLRLTEEGELADFPNSRLPTPKDDVEGTTGEETFVDLYLAAYVRAAADVESTCIPENPSDVNSANATAVYNLLDWDSRVLPATVSPETTPGGPAPAAEQARDCVTNNNLDETAQSFIGRCCKASIHSEFPGEMYDKTLREIKYGKTAAHKKAWKLLNRKEYRK